MIAASQIRKEQSVIPLKFEKNLLKELLKITRDPDTGLLGLKQERFAVLCKRAAEDLGISDKVKVSQKTVSNWTSGETAPDVFQATAMGKVLNVYFLADWGNVTNNDGFLEMLKASHH